MQNEYNPKLKDEFLKIGDVYKWMAPAFCRGLKFRVDGVSHNEHGFHYHIVYLDVPHNRLFFAGQLKLSHKFVAANKNRLTKVFNWAPSTNSADNG
jgi:hypothetical protein